MSTASPSPTPSGAKNTTQSTRNQKPRRSDWWWELGLSPSGLHEWQRAIRKVLERHPPVGFARDDGDDGPLLTVEQLKQLIETGVTEEKQARRQAQIDRRAADDAAFEAAFDLPDGDALIEEGRWAGFTRSEATAWCQNLFQYEPHGFVSPGVETRVKAKAELDAGGLPVVFGYPERAQELKERGMTPREYRQYRLVMRSPMFGSEDVGPDGDDRPEREGRERRPFL